MKVLGFGSLNIDYVFKVPHIVQPGESLTSSGFDMFCGGKGLNQSLAMAKTGIEVYQAGRIGKDGVWLLDQLKAAGVHTSGVEVAETMTGKALIQVDSEGMNGLVVYPGANRELTKDFIDQTIAGFNAGDVIVLQNEVNHLDYIIEKAYERGMIIMLNPSPFDDYIGACDLSKVRYFFMNEIEGAQMTGEQTPELVLDEMLLRYPNGSVILTLGGEGSWYSDRKQRIFQKAIGTDVVDTTAAGDTFSGYFIYGVVTGKSPKESLEIAALAASIAVSRPGASVSIPTIDEVAAMKKMRKDL